MSDIIENYLNKDWYVPEVGPLKLRGRLPQSLVSIEGLIKRGFIHPNYPIGKKDDCVKRAHEFEDINRMLMEFCPDYERKLKEDPILPENIVERLYKKAVPESTPLSELPSLAEATKVELDELDEARKEPLEASTSSIQTLSESQIKQFKIRKLSTAEFEAAVNHDDAEQDAEMPSEPQVSVIADEPDKQVVEEQPEEMDNPEDNSEESQISDKIDAEFREDEMGRHVDHDDTDDDVEDDGVVPGGALPDAPEPAEDQVTYEREWWLPLIPQFQGKNKVPQTLHAIEMLIKSNELYPEQFIKRAHGDPNRAGLFPELQELFQQAGAHYDPELLEQLPVHEVPEFEDERRERMAERHRTLHRPPPDDVNIYVKGGILGFITGLIFFAVCITTQAGCPPTMYAFVFAYPNVTMQYYLMALLYNIVIGVAIGEMLAFVHYLWDLEAWNLLAGILTGALLTSFVSISINYFMNTDTLIAVLAGFMDLFKVLDYVMRGVVLCLIGLWFYYPSKECIPGGHVRGWEKSVFIPIILITILAATFQVMTLSRIDVAAIGVKDRVDNAMAPDIQVKNVISEFIETQKRNVITGKLVNTSKDKTLSWEMYVYLFDEQDNLLKRKKLINGIDVTEIETPTWNDEFTKQNMLREANNPTNFLSAGNEYDFLVEMKNLKAIPDYYVIEVSQRTYSP